jgi:hypothetical protein
MSTSQYRLHSMLINSPAHHDFGFCRFIFLYTYIHFTNALAKLILATTCATASSRLPPPATTGSLRWFATRVRYECKEKLCALETVAYQHV